MIHFVLCSVLCLVASTFSLPEWDPPPEYEICRTPVLREGQCIEIRQCPSLLDLLLERPLPPTNLEILKMSHCGFIGIVPKVCCSLTDTKSEASPLSSKSLSTEEVTSDLLPDTNICGKYHAERIIGSDYVELDELPWMVLIQYQTPNGIVCSCEGTLISKRYVLTAAHCVDGSNFPSDWNVTGVHLGDHDTDIRKECLYTVNKDFCSDPPVEVPVEEQIIHEEYSPDNDDYHHDIALLRLSQDVAFTDFIAPVCLPSTKNSDHKDLNHTGFLNFWSKKQGSQGKVKQRLRVQHLPNKNCSATLAKYGVNITSGQLCAANLERSRICSRTTGGSSWITFTDSPNPQWYIAGIHSSGPASCNMGPDIYTRVSNYVPWISSKLKP